MLCMYVHVYTCTLCVWQELRRQCSEHKQQLSDSDEKHTAERQQLQEQLTQLQTDNKQLQLQVRWYCMHTAIDA